MIIKMKSLLTRIAKKFQKPAISHMSLNKQPLETVMKGHCIQIKFSKIPCFGCRLKDGYEFRLIGTDYLCPSCREIINKSVSNNALIK